MEDEFVELSVDETSLEDLSIVLSMLSVNHVCNVNPRSVPHSDLLLSLTPQTRGRNITEYH